ncbi:MAG TPA: hypothetical protein VFR48_03755 [Solirubrobacteraceae bacterium]|nr:hypothetical protein [Solirubrobacteraceae bacterium]
MPQEQMQEQEQWLGDPIEEELPRRPRRKLLGVGGNPVALALIGLLLSACGFIGGVLIEKGQSSSTSSGSVTAGGLASRFAALRSGATSATGSARGASAGGGAASLFAGGAGAGATVGQVAYTAGHTLYVTDSEGNTVKVTTSSASTVTKTIKADVKAIHPGETVIVTGSANANGTVKADSIRVSEASSGGALGALFGGGGGFAGRGRGGAGSGGETSRATGGGASAGGSEGPVLFGK